MNRLVEEFNQTVGMEKGIIINVTGMSNASHIGKKLPDAKAGKPDTGEMPDLFFGHKSNAAEIGTENLVDWKELFSEKELSGFVPEFLSYGEENEKLYVFPVTKSTFLLFVSGSQFERFSKDTNVTYVTEKYFSEENISFSALRNNQSRIETPEDKYMDLLRQELLKIDCSGAFFQNGVKTPLILTTV